MRRTSTASRALMMAAAALAATAAAGCGGAFDFRDDEAVRAVIDAHREPLGLRAVLALTGMPRQGAAGSEGGRVSLPPDRGELLRAMAGALAEIGLFSSVDVIEYDAAGSAPDPADAAWERDADVLLEVDVKRWDVAWRGTNWAYLPNLFLWFQFEFPSWFVRDEDYAVEASAEIVARSAHTGTELFRSGIESERVRSLDDFQRGWLLFGILRVPGALTRSNFEKVAGIIGAEGMHEFLARFAASADAAMRSAALSPGFAGANRKTLAVIAGVQNYSHHRLPRAKFARDDARDLAEFMTAASGWGLPARNVTLLRDESATKVAVEAALADAARRARPGDEVVFYFAGNGTLAPLAGNAAPKRFILCYDADPDSIAASSTGLDHVLSVLGSARGRAVALVDASFRQGGGERCFKAPLAAAGRAPAPQASAPGVSLLFSCGADQECGVFEDRGRGFFSWFLLEALRGAGDADRDGRVSIREAFLHAKREVEVQAFVDGFGDQNPMATGEPLPQR